MSPNAHEVQKLKLQGTVAANSETVSMRSFRGEEAEIEVLSETAGKFTVEVTTKPAPTQVDADAQKDG